MRDGIIYTSLPQNRLPCKGWVLNQSRMSVALSSSPQDELGCDELLCG